MTGTVSPCHVVVTGSRGGIGQAIISVLAEEPELLTGPGPNREVIVTGLDLPEHDVSDAPAMERAIAEIEESAPVDVLIHTAGILEEDSALHLDPDHLRHSFAVNACGVANTCAPVARRMTERGHGAIVVVSSNAANTPRAGMASYCASKAAATAWTRALALECAPYGVRCNIVSPGSTNTPMLRGMWPDGQDNSADVIAGNAEDYRLGIPLKRLAQPEDIARACLFLASEQAKHITLHDLRVDGGATLDL